MADDEMIFRLDTEFRLSASFRETLSKLSETHRISAVYQPVSMFDALSMTERGAVGILTISLTDKVSGNRDSIAIKVSIAPGSDNEAAFDEAAEKLNVRYGLNKPKCNIIKDGHRLFREILKELNSRGEFEIDIPKFVDILFKLGLVTPADEEKKHDI